MSRIERYWQEAVKGYTNLNEGHFGSGFERYVWFQRKMPPPPKKILEIGCNSAEALNVLASLGYECTAIDYPEVIDKIKGHNPKINYVGMNIDVPNVNDKILWKDYFDVVILGEVLQHIIFDENLLYLCYKYLKPSGHLLISTEQRKIHGGGHTVRYYPKEILLNTLSIMGFDEKDWCFWTNSGNPDDYIWVHAQKAVE